MCSMRWRIVLLVVVQGVMIVFIQGKHEAIYIQREEQVDFQSTWFFV